MESINEDDGWLESGDTSKTRDALQAGNCRVRDAPAIIAIAMIQDWLILHLHEFQMEEW